MMPTIIYYSDKYRVAIRNVWRLITHDQLKMIFPSNNVQIFKYRISFFIWQTKICANIAVYEAKTFWQHKLEISKTFKLVKKRAFIV